MKQGKTSEAAAMLDAAEKISGLEDGTIVTLRLTRAQWLSCSGKSAQADKLFAQTMDDATRLHYVGKALVNPTTASKATNR